MRKLILIPLLIVASIGLAPSASAQQATLTTPIVRSSEHNLRVESTFATRDSGGRWEVQVSVRDSGGVEIRRVSFSGPDATHPTATVAAFNTAVSHTILGDETGSNARKTDHRVQTFLNTQGYYTPLFGAVTLVP